MAKGRNKYLIEKRNEALCRRYHYWTEIQRLRFDDALRILSEQEFFISEERILAVVRENVSRLNDLAAVQVKKVKVPRLTAAQLSLFKD